VWKHIPVVPTTREAEAGGLLAPRRVKLTRLDNFGPRLKNNSSAGGSHL
jgi:hypothetical protein